MATSPTGRFARPYFVNREGNKSVDVYCRCGLHSEYTWDTVRAIVEGVAAGTVTIDSMRCSRCEFDWSSEMDRLKRACRIPE